MGQRDAARRERGEEKGEKGCEHRRDDAVWK